MKMTSENFQLDTEDEANRFNENQSIDLQRMYVCFRSSEVHIFSHIQVIKTQNFRRGLFERSTYDKVPNGYCQ